MQRFVNRNEPISLLFKLYPWEWLCQDAFAAELARSAMTLLEPAWKQVLSHKGLSPLDQGRIKSLEAMLKDWKGQDLAVE